MSTEVAKKEKTPMSLSAFFADKKVMQGIEKVMGENAQSMVTSALQVCASNSMLKNATNSSVYGSIMTAATMNLPINNNLGFAYIVPFNNRKAGVVEAQFQIGYKGLIQLAKRSGQVKTIATTPIYEGQLKRNNPLLGCEFDFDNQESKKVIGYAAYYEEINGFSKLIYSTVEQIEAHAQKYSQTYKNKYGVWKDNFEEMAQKTVLKTLLSKYATMSIELQTALVNDQAVINNGDIRYPDNEQNIKDIIDENANKQTISIDSDKVKTESINKETGEIKDTPAEQQDFGF